MANSTGNNESSDYVGHEILLAQRHSYFYIILCFEIILGFSGNTLFLLSFIKAKNCTSNMYEIMKSLSVVDIGSSLSFILYPIQELLVKDYRIQYELCRFHIYFQNTFSLNNVLHIFLMGIDRYAAISMPHRYK